MSGTQLHFNWETHNRHAASNVETTACLTALDPPQGRAAAGRTDGLPIPDGPLPAAVEAGMFGFSVAGPIEPDPACIVEITEEHANQLLGLLGEIDLVTQSIRDGCSPGTGRVPRTPENLARLRESLRRDEQLLKQTYAEAIAVYEEAFGQNAARMLDEWVRTQHAATNCTGGNYDAGHPWYYYRGGDNRPPLAVSEIEPNYAAGEFIAERLPKTPAKRTQKLRELLTQEETQLATDQRRYQDLIDRGAEALSQFDREIAHGGNDELARASALALKFNHIRNGLGRIVWLSSALADRRSISKSGPAGKKSC